MIQSESDKTAIAWVIAKNNEQSSSLESQKKAYREGIVDAEKDLPPGIVETQEEYPPTPIPPDGLEISVDPDGRTNGEPFIGNLGNGIYFDCGETTYKGETDHYTVKISVDYSVTNISIGLLYEGVLKWELYGSSGLTAYDYSIGSGNWFVRQYTDTEGVNLYRYVEKWRIRPAIGAIEGEHRDYGTPRIYNQRWENSSGLLGNLSVSTGDLNYIKQVWVKAKTISTLPTT